MVVKLLSRFNSILNWISGRYVMVVFRGRSYQILNPNQIYSKLPTGWNFFSVQAHVFPKNRVWPILSQLTILTTINFHLGLFFSVKGLKGSTGQKCLIWCLGKLKFGGPRKPLIGRPPEMNGSPSLKNPCLGV